MEDKRNPIVLDVSVTLLGEDLIVLPVTWIVDHMAMLTTQLHVQVVPVMPDGKTVKLDIVICVYPVFVITEEQQMLLVMDVTVLTQAWQMEHIVKTAINLNAIILDTPTLPAQAVYVIMVIAELNAILVVVQIMELFRFHVFLVISQTIEKKQFRIIFVFP